MGSLEGSGKLLDLEMQLDPAMIKGKIIYPGNLRSFHFYNYFPEDSLHFVEPCQSDLLDLEKLVLLILDFADLIVQVVQSSVCEPPHQYTKNSTEDGGANHDGGMTLDPEVLRPHRTRVLLFDPR